ncbi:hypothetical protein F3Y22_tig00110933pilonHSYRG00204 [Hibiscus syriacus]|uniref:HAT C-terminal dimerisation domain-containing protein n=1 Tax=Hibiscus syriacus TaxID=106335 RepID=A0A6A2ZCB3_HIBSY|nr:hypothetical protein F3Y22_tig00110933pilonHSYRG00204 [Hibiscus syriacus]
MSSEPQSSSIPIGVSRVEEFFVNVDDEHNKEECNIEASEPTVDSTTKEVEVENPFKAFKRPRRSKVWDDFFEPEIINEQSKVRKVFPRYALHDHSYKHCLDDDEWGKIEKLLEILKVFKATTNIISGSEYPTSNMFLGEVQRIKVLLDSKFESTDDFVKNMVGNMKERFDKYWGECNLLMAIGSVLDPRLKMRDVEIAFPKMFPSHLVRENISKVKDIMYKLFDEYLTMHSSSCNVEESEEHAFSMDVHGGDVTSSGLYEFLQDVFSGETFVPRVKFELDSYLDEGCIFSQDVKFDVIAWWKEKSNKFRILSRIAVNVLAVPITTVASEATFSAESRVIDPYRSSLTP